MIRLGKKKYSENNVLIGGQLIRAQGKSLHYNVDAEFVVAGEDAGSFSIKGTGELNLPVLKDTAQLVVNAYVKNSAPGFYYRHYHSKHAWWDKDYDKIMRGLRGEDGNDVSDTSPTYKGLEDGSFAAALDEQMRIAQRQAKFIQGLQGALIRIENKTYGICRETGKLISKERLMAVPHATLSIEAKKNR